MKTAQPMKPAKITVLVALIALSVACGYSAKTTPPVAGMMPAISQLAPNSANAGAAFILTVDGSNFASKAVVNFNGAAQITTFISASQLTASVAATAVATAGTAAVTVTNPGTTGTGMYGSGGTMAATSSPMNFTVN
jgi:IPT/TIG domain